MVGVKMLNDFLAYKTDDASVYLGSNLDVLPFMADNSVDSIVTDPPYELGFMGKSWDSSGIAYSVELWRECLRVLKPGGHLLAFSGSRTYHRMTVSVEDAGFEVRDMIAWISDKRMPKSLNVSKAISKTADSNKSQEWLGWGTGLKPTVEPIVLARKPFPNNVAENILKYGTGGLNINATRVKTENHVEGRWPANVIFDETAAAALDEQSGISKSPPTYIRKKDSFGKTSYGLGQAAGTESKNYNDIGGASRFFYVAKASKNDRNEGLNATQNIHPTVKPTNLMQYLIKLVTPIGGIVFDPFTGSGSTGKAALLDGYKFVGIELTEDYLPIIEGRLKYAADKTKETNNDEGKLF